MRMTLCYCFSSTPTRRSLILKNFRPHNLHSWTQEIRRWGLCYQAASPSPLWWIFEVEASPEVWSLHRTQPSLGQTRRTGKTSACLPLCPGVAICADFWGRVLWVEIHYSANLSRATTTDWILRNFLGWIRSSRLVVSGAGLVWQDFHTSSLSSMVASMWLMWHPSGVSWRWFPFMFRKWRARGHLRTYTNIFFHDNIMSSAFGLATLSLRIPIQRSGLDIVMLSSFLSRYFFWWWQGCAPHNCLVASESVR